LKNAGSMIAFYHVFDLASLGFIPLHILNMFLVFILVLNVVARIFFGFLTLLVGLKRRLCIFY